MAAGRPAAGAASAASPAPAGGEGGSTNRAPSRWAWRMAGETNADYQERVLPVTGADDQPIRLRNYHAATNATLARVVSFLRTNPVNLARFEPGKFVCTEYARALHNAAEAAGLRCALVTVQFEQGEGHSLNAFETTDQGLVYVDCTGSPGANTPAAEFDTFGYLKTGRPYGRLQLDLGLADPSGYERYELVTRMWTQGETEERYLSQAGRQLLAEDRALRAEEQRLQSQLQAAAGPAAALERQGRELAQRRAALDRRHAELTARQAKFEAHRRQWRLRIFHSNPAPVKGWRTWW